MKISLFPNIKANEPSIFEGHIETIGKGLLADCANGATAKNQIPLWSPTIFQGRRSSSNARFITCLVYDLDDGLTPFSTWRLFSDWSLMAHTSFSHKPQHHKYRIILPLKKPVPAEEWDRASQWALMFWNEAVGRGEPDPKALKDRARIYFRYAVPFSDLSLDDPNHPANYFQTISQMGAPLLNLDWESIPKQEPKKEAAEKTYKKTGPITVEALELDSRFRERIASQCGAKILGNNARYITCPQCGDNSVYFSIDLDMPNSIKWPQCNHRNSCQWWGSLKDLF